MYSNTWLGGRFRLERHISRRDHLEKLLSATPSLLGQGGDQPGIPDTVLFLGENGSDPSVDCQ